MTRPKWMSTLPVPPAQLTLDQLRNFKQVHEYLQVTDLRAPATVKAAYQAFRFLFLFGCILLEERRFPALNRCWDDLQKRFSRSPNFGDGVFLESWIFIDFPVDRSGTTVLDEFAAFHASMAERDPQLATFIAGAKASRLGLHQETISTTRTTRYKELFTGRETSTLRSVPEYGRGEIFLGRIIEFGRDRFLLGDPKSWPAPHRDALIDMVSRRLVDLPGATTVDKYELFMRVAGPYWMSCVSGGANDEILSPDHLKTYDEAPDR